MKVLSIRCQENSYGHDFKGRFTRAVFYKVEGKEDEVKDIICGAKRKILEQTVDQLKTKVKSGKVEVQINEHNRVVKLFCAA